MGKGDYHGFRHIYASWAGTRPGKDYDTFDFSSEKEAKKDDLLRPIRRPALTIQAGYVRRPKKTR